ncbi:nuclear transport factor 2 family protein [Pseudoduganella danionis]|uniref:DUF4440 domain-containing protein n=1 Tax=Pseudoduganella danionis TaxID=1890295 RepID=A0ABW9SNM2_9BURK|nr:nuclear transport factor 2 family protein [Pseudoduganella danionis]MTW33184.1 DUF4440 domain-containing protein [Pseudoduganella danionis]
MMKSGRWAACAFALGMLQAFLLPSVVAADDWERSARRADEAYWNAYNRADADGMNAFLADDVEFYHDRGGTLIGKPALAAANDSMKGSAVRMRRAAIPGTVRFFPMRLDEQVYGVLVTGEHAFYVTPKGEAEFKAGQAYFTQLMRMQGQDWRISRIFSYEHVDAAPVPKLPAHLAGSWGTNASLFAGTASQAQLYLAPDGLGMLAGSSSAPVSLGGAPAMSGPAPRAIIGVPVQAELDNGGLRLQALMPQKSQLQVAHGMVFVCSYDAAAPTLICTAPNKEVLRLSRLSENLTNEAQTQLEQLRALKRD